VIGIGVAAGVALSAVNLYQTMKLKQAVERLEVRVNNGFINLEQALKDQGQKLSNKFIRLPKISSLSSIG
jgi:hypothetical protein